MRSKTTANNRGLACAFGALAVAAIALPASAQTLTVTDITKVQEAGYQVTVPTVEIVDGNLTEDDVRQLFFVGPPSVADKLSELNAARVTIPQIVLTYKVGDEDTTTTYSDIVLTNVVDGVAATASVGGTSVDGADDVAVTMGAMAMADFDIGTLLAFYGLGNESGFTDLRTVYSNATFEGGTLEAEDVSCTFGGGRSDEFRARPIAGTQNFFAMIAEIEAATEANRPPSPEAISGMIAWYADLFRAFESAPMLVDGFDCSGEDDEGRPIQVAAGNIEIGAFSGPSLPQMSLDAFRVVVPNEGQVGFSNFTLKPMEFSGAMSSLEEIGGGINEAWAAANWRSLIPVMEGFSIAGVEIDVPNPDSQGERVQLNLGLFDLTLTDYVNAIPSVVDLLVEELRVDIPEEPGDNAFFADLRGAGITGLAIDLGSSMRWNEADQTIDVTDLYLDTPELGLVRITGQLGNATRALFADDPREVERAAMTMTVRNLSIDLEDRGLLGLAVAAGARDAQQTEEAFRTMMSAMSQGTVLAMLGASPDSMTTAGAIAGFLGGTASRLTLDIAAVDPAGLGLADLQAFSTNPTLVAGKVTVNATAEGAPAQPAASATPAAASPPAVSTPAPAQAAAADPARRVVKPN